MKNLICINVLILLTSMISYAEETIEERCNRAFNSDMYNFKSVIERDHTSISNTGDKSADREKCSVAVSSRFSVTESKPEYVGKLLGERFKVELKECQDRSEVGISECKKNIEEFALKDAFSGLSNAAQDKYSVLKKEEILVIAEKIYDSAPNSFTNENFESALYGAIDSDSAEYVTFLINKGSNKKYVTGSPNVKFLIHALERRLPNVVELLVSGARLGHLSDQGNNAFYYAVKSIDGANTHRPQEVSDAKKSLNILIAALEGSKPPIALANKQKIMADGVLGAFSGKYNFATSNAFAALKCLVANGYDLKNGSIKGMSAPEAAKSYGTDEAVAEVNKLISNPEAATKENCN